MGSSIIKYVTLIFILGIAKFGNTQNVFNKSFDNANLANYSTNTLEWNKEFYVMQKIYTGFSNALQVIKLDSMGQLILKEIIIEDSNNSVRYGYAGSFQIINDNELCQLFRINNDNALYLAYFDQNINVSRTFRYGFNNDVYPSVINNTNDSTILILGLTYNTLSSNLVLINTDLQGNERWRTTFGTPGKDDSGFAIEYINNKILVSGNSKDLGPHIFEFDLNGNLTFDTIYSNYDFGRNIIFHPNFGLYFLVDRKNIGNSQRFPVLLKLNSNNQIQWYKEYFTEDVYTYFQQLTINDQGIITFGGGSMVNNEFMGLFFQANHNGDSLGSKLLDYIPGERAQFHDIRPTSDGAYILAGETRAPSQDSWIVKVNEWGCDNIPCIVSVAEQPENERGELICYPNPSNGLGTLKVSFKNADSNNEVKVFNSLGQLVFTKIITTKDFEMEVNLPNSGLYLVNLYQGNELVESLKWVVR